MHILCIIIIHNHMSIRRFPISPSLLFSFLWQDFLFAVPVACKVVIPCLLNNSVSISLEYKFIPFIPVWLILPFMAVLKCSFTEVCSNSNCGIPLLPSDFFFPQESRLFSRSSKTPYTIYFVNICLLVARIDQTIVESFMIPCDYDIVMYLYYSIWLIIYI